MPESLIAGLSQPVRIQRAPKRKLHVAMLSPIAWRTPPRAYGPWELVVSNLTEALVQAGVDVTLFATADSLTAARLRGVAPLGYEEDRTLDVKVWECLHISEVFEHADDFDIIHNHFDFLPLTYSRLVETPVVTTIHGFSSQRILPVYKKYNAWTHYVSISDADRSPELDYVATIHHGVNTREFEFVEDPGDHLAFFGRIHPDKGVVEAIQCARACGRRLMIAGIIQDEVYFRQRVEPELGADVRYVGAIPRERRVEILGRAAALLHLINFDEPFGLTVIESMLHGTPVVAVNRGSMPELINPGQNGMLVPDAASAPAAVEMAVSLDRATVRADAVQRFSAERMAKEYIEVYRNILSGRTLNSIRV